MSIKSQGGVFGRNPTFNDVTIEGSVSIDGTLSIGGETITGLSYQGGWNASTNTPDIAASSPTTGQFWIVSADGSTNVGGITNWTSGDWALYDGSAWQRVEGGNTDLTTGVQGQLAIANGGTGAADASTARTNLGLGTAATTAATDYATSAQGALADTAIQPADLGTAAYTASTDYATAAQGTTADSALQPADIGVSVQAYDADTAKYDDASADFSTDMTIGDQLAVGTTEQNGQLHVYSGDSGASRNSNCNVFIENNGSAGISIGTPSSSSGFLMFADEGGTGRGFVQYDHTTDYLNLAAAGSTRVSIQGNNIALNNGGGIDFSATSGTGTSELLDDYEEGTFTPTLDTSTTSSPVYDTRSGTYTKIGRLVVCSIYVKLDGHSGTTGNTTWFYGGLPFTVGQSNSEGSYVSYYSNGGTINGVGSPVTGSTTASFFGSVSNSANQVYKATITYTV